MIAYIAFGIALTIGLPIAIQALVRLGVVVYVTRSYRRASRDFADVGGAFRQFADASFKMSLAISEREDVKPEWFNSFRSYEALLHDESNAPSQRLLKAAPL